MASSKRVHLRVKWKIRHHIKPGDIGYLIYLHGILYAKECGYGQTFEAYVAGGLAEFVQSFSPDKDRIWLAEIKGRIIGSIAIVGHLPIMCYSDFIESYPQTHTVMRSCHLM